MFCTRPFAFSCFSSVFLMYNRIWLLFVASYFISWPQPVMSSCLTSLQVDPKFYSKTIYLIKLKIKANNCKNNHVSLCMSELFLTFHCWVSRPFKMSLCFEPDIKITSMKYYWQVSHCSQWEPCTYFSSRCAILSLNENLLFQMGGNMLFLLRNW